MVEIVFDALSELTKCITLKGFGRLIDQLESPTLKRVRELAASIGLVIMTKPELERLQAGMKNADKFVSLNEQLDAIRDVVYSKMLTNVTKMTYINQIVEDENFDITAFRTRTGGEHTLAD